MGFRKGESSLGVSFFVVGGDGGRKATSEAIFRHSFGCWCCRCGGIVSGDIAGRVEPTVDVQQDASSRKVKPHLLLPPRPPLLPQQQQHHRDVPIDAEGPRFWRG